MDRRKCGWPPEAGKGKETDVALESQRNQTLTLAFGTLKTRIVLL